MYNSVFDYISSNVLSILRAFIIIYSILIIAIKFIAFTIKKEQINIQEEKIITSKETEIQEQQSTTLYLAAVNLSVIIILCLCVVVFFLVQHGYHNQNICHYNLTEYWNILFAYFLSINFIAPDVDILFKTNITNSIVFTKWVKTFEVILLTLYIPITILLMIIC